MALRGDATNSAVWQKSKLRTSEIEAKYITRAVEADDDWATVEDSIKYNKILGELQVCAWGSGPGCYALIEKSASSVHADLGYGNAEEALHALCDADGEGRAALPPPAGMLAAPPPPLPSALPPLPALVVVPPPPKTRLPLVVTAALVKLNVVPP